MSEIANIVQDDGWFRGEKKTISITMQDATNVATFTLEWIMQFPATKEDVLVKSGADISVADGPLGSGTVVLVDIKAADTVDLEARAYAHTLRRTDSGFEQVLSQGSALLQEAAVRDTEES